jgi:dienelactone hydrolase
VIQRRRLFGYDEWKIEYQAYDAATMPFPAGQRIPAYLLIPAQKRTLTGKTHYSTASVPEPPFPAAICFHQCCVHCDLGKEAVVGKVVDRPDQAYGLELVRSGFVVLAPDSVCCGERNVLPGREDGERIHCIAGLRDAPRYQPLRDLYRFDGMRAVDLLASLDFVDAGRIAAVGHSGGGSWTAATMAQDPRIKAGITSGWVPTVQQLACIAPRLLIQLLGAYDEPADVEAMKRNFAAGKQFYEELGVEENLVLRMPPCAHHFLDGFKWEAYARLKQHFGIDDDREHLFVEDVLRTALETTTWAWQDFDLFPHICSAGQHRILANMHTLEAAFRALLLTLSHSVGYDSRLEVAVEAEGGAVRVICRVPRRQEGIQGAMDHYLREAEQLFVENGASLARDPTPGELRWVVSLPESN